MSIRRYFEFMHRHRALMQTAFVVILTAAYIWFIQEQENESKQQEQASWVHNFENYILQLRLQTRPPPRVPSDVVIISVDEGCFDSDAVDAEILKDKKDPKEVRAAIPELSYLSSRNQGWPFDNALWASVTNRLFESGALFVAYDFPFNKTTSIEGDQKFTEAFDHYADQMAVASYVGSSYVTLGSKEWFANPDPKFLPHKGGDVVGFSNQHTDSDKIVRRITQAYNVWPATHDRYVVSNSRTVRLSAHWEYSLSWVAAKKVASKDKELDYDPIFPMMLNFYGPADTIKTIPLWYLLINWDTVYDHGAYFKGKTVFVGTDAEERFNQFMYNTPMELMSGVEIQATSYANLVHGEYLRPAPDWIVLTLVLSLGVMSLAVSLWMRAVLVKLGLFLGLAGIFLEATQHLFWSYLIVTPVAGAAIILVGCGICGTLYDYLLEQYERQRTLDTFENMVSPGVANFVLSHRGDLEKRLTGQRQEIVVLFGDIRNFTKLSEKLDPETLVAQLNEYLEKMVGVIQEEGGTLQKYIGDAVMAAWGDVRVQPAAEGAEHAVRAALRMQESLVHLNELWKARPGREQLFLGVGVNHGECVVGRIGHPRRQEFTVLGDPVNLASRLESATKQYRQPILVGESVYEMTKELFIYRFVDKLLVQGKSTAVRVYTPLAERKMAQPPAGLAEYNSAMEKYYARDFAGATELFQLAKQKFGGVDILCDIFIARCDYYYRHVPPPAEWDGTWQLTEK